uniref:CAP-Gly domain-containing protein n=1 Tax=Sinocyclocheilus rhinocerous TaxID=307959 RepID=A0A673IS72_9TELE
MLINTSTIHNFFRRCKNLIGIFIFPEKCSEERNILKRGCGFNDRDGLTDMTLLHYCCKAGAPGIGDAESAACFARQLLLLGAEPSLRSRWTNMNALHYAAYFDVPPLIRVVLQASRPGEVDATCSDFHFGTALHIAASNLCTSAVKCLLELGANPAFRLLSHAVVVKDPVDEWSCMRYNITQRCCLSMIPIQIEGPYVNLSLLCGSRLFCKVGTLWFCGSTEFAVGKNDGSVAGVQYFSCPIKHGIFAPLSKVSKLSERRKNSPRQPTAPVPHPRWIDLARVTSKVNTGLLSRSCSTSSSSLDSRQAYRRPPRPLPRQRPPLRPLQEQTPPRIARSRTPSASSTAQESLEVHLGEHVLVVGQRTGVVRYYDKTSFAPGFWLGIDLDKPSGKNDGSVGGVRYFSCPPKHGVFAPPSRVQRQVFSDIWSLFSGCFTSSAIATQREPSRKSQASSSSGSDGTVKLHLGMQVLLISANEMGTIRYIGTADFAPGLWLGLELRSPKGKNYGSVGSRRYFSCRPGHGVLVRPSRVTYRGINGAKLVDESS